MDGIIKSTLSVFIILVIHFYLLIPIGESLAWGIAALLLFWYIGDETSRHLPPGPRQLPLLGNLGLLVANDADEYIFEAIKKYGPIVTIKLGLGTTVFVGDYNMIKELGVHPDIQLRPHNDILYDVSDGLGIASSDGNLWKHQRRFILHALRDSGMGQHRMQEKIHDELDKVFGVMEKSNGSPMKMKELLEKSTANVICALAFNRQFDYDDEDFMTQINALNSNFNLFEKSIILESFPVLKIFAKGMRKTIFDNTRVMDNQSREFIDEHKATLDPDNPRDLVDLFLIEMNKTVEDGKEDSEYHKTFFERQLIKVIVDLFSAGAETSSTTISWALLYMIHHPDIQEKVRKEIDSVVGTERYPQMNDRANLPFTIATLQEIERLGSVASFTLSRCNGKPIRYQGYVLPEGTEFLFALYAVHVDPKLWKEPRTFNPLRFIDSDGKVFRPPHLLPFGSGKRSCVGEALAKMEIFLYFATLLQNFVFEAPDKNNPPSLKPVSGFARSPANYQIVCHRRQL